MGRARGGDLRTSQSPQMRLSGASPVRDCSAKRSQSFVVEMKLKRAAVLSSPTATITPGCKDKGIRPDSASYISAKGKRMLSGGAAAKLEPEIPPSTVPAWLFQKTEGIRKTKNHQ